MTTANFEQYAGKHNRDQWGLLEDFLDAHFRKEFNWREICEWDKHFTDSNRNYLTLSLGFQISIEIPYAYLQEIDKIEDNYDALTELFVGIQEYFSQIL